MTMTGFHPSRPIPRPQGPARKCKADFGEFAGKWSEREAAEFNARVARTIDAEDWR